MIFLIIKKFYFLAILSLENDIFQILFKNILRYCDTNTKLR